MSRLMPLLKAQTGLQEPLLSNDYIEQEPQDEISPTEQSASSPFWLDHASFMLMLSKLLCWQFAMAIHCSSLMDEVYLIPTYEVSTAICLFVVTSFVYKQCIANKMRNIPLVIQPVLYLLPEIMADVIFATVLLVGMDVALTTLLASTLVVSLPAIGSALHDLCTSEVSEEDREEGLDV